MPYIGLLLVLLSLSACATGSVGLSDAQKAAVSRTELAYKGCIITRAQSFDSQLGSIDPVVNAVVGACSDQLKVVGKELQAAGFQRDYIGQYLRSAPVNAANNLRLVMIKQRQLAMQPPAGQ